MIRWLVLSMALAVPLMTACDGGVDGPNLSPGAVIAYQQQMRESWGESNDVSVRSVSIDGDRIAMIVVWGTRTFTWNPAPVGSDGPESGGGVKSSQFLLVASTDGGATFTQRPLRGDPSISGDLEAIHLHAGRSFAIVATATGQRVYEMDLATGHVGGLVPGQNFGPLGGRQLVAAGPLITLHNVYQGGDPYDITYAYEQFNVLTGQFTSQITPTRSPDGCATLLASVDDGKTWTGYNVVSTAGGVLKCPDECLFTVDLTQNPVPTRTCVPPSAWPATDVVSTSLVVPTERGPVTAYSRNDQAYASWLEAGVPIVVPLGPGVTVGGGDYVQQPLTGRGRLIPIVGSSGDQATARLVRLPPSGPAEDVPLPRSACVNDSCVQHPVFVGVGRSGGYVGYGDLVEALPLGGDRWLGIYVTDIGTDREVIGSVIVRKVTAPPVPIVD